MRKLTALAIPLVLGFGLATVNSESAQAAPCTPTPGYIAGWDGTDTCAGKLWNFVWNIIPAGGPCVYLDSNMRNKTSYVYNNTAEQWRAWTGPGCSGSNAPLYAHNGGPMGGVFQNNIEGLSRDN